MRGSFARSTSCRDDNGLCAVPVPVSIRHPLSTIAPTYPGFRHIVDTINLVYGAWCHALLRNSARLAVGRWTLRTYVEGPGSGSRGRSAACSKVRDQFECVELPILKLLRVDSFLIASSDSAANAALASRRSCEHRPSRQRDLGRPGPGNRRRASHCRRAGFVLL